MSRNPFRPRASALLILACLLLLLPFRISRAADAAAVNPGAVTTGQAQASQATQDSAQAKGGGGGAVPAAGDSLSAASKSKSDSVIVVKHAFDHREQIITGSVVMTCLMLMMVTMNNYNPR